MMMLLLTLSTMVVWIVWVDPGSDVVVGQEGEQNGRA
jgi:hypothetical protein